MDFEDSFFDESDNETKRSTEQERSKTSYQARFCEQKWYLVPGQHSSSHQATGSIHDMTFMTMKYKADLFYYQGDHCESARLYKNLLDLVPKENGCVIRELRDALARSLLKIGHAKAAKTEVQQLLIPPRDNDWSAWRLLAQCHKELLDTEAEVAALQRAILLQRSYPNFWINLSSAYKSLQHEWTCRTKAVPCSSPCVGGSITVDDTRTAEDGSPSSVPCEGGVKSVSVLEDILAQTVLLFRPYFSWRTDQECSDETRVVENSKHAPPSSTSKSEQTGYPVQAIESLSCSEHSPYCGISVSGSTKYGQKHDCTHSTSEKKTSHSDYALTCTKLCPLHGVSLSRDKGTTSSEVYTSKLMDAMIDEKPQMKDDPLLPSPCFHHSLFVVLVRGIVSPEEVGELVCSMKDSLQGLLRLNSMLDQFTAMAECSCLLWAKQLLLYAARYSVSFSKESVESELKEVEACLEACPSRILHYIKQHFSRRTVFDGMD